MMRCAALAAALLLAGCAATPPAPRTIDAPIDADDRFFAADADAPRPGPADLAWWRRFDDPALTAWIERALQRNLDLAQARARTDEARALLRAAQAGHAAQIGARAELAASSRGGAEDRPVMPSAALTLDWDADLWGGLAATETAAAARVAERDALQRAARLSTAALAARAYLAWREALLARTQLDVAIVLQREVARVVDVRVDAGLSPALDGQRTRAELAATEADAVAAGGAVRSAERALQLLAAERPGPALPAPQPAAPLPQLQGPQPVSLPLDLLRMRPDLRAAEQAWRAAVADLGIAEAARKPTLRLPGALTIGSAGSGQLLGQVTASIAAALLLPLIDGGLREAGRDAAEARLQVAELAYRSTLQRALADVEAALRAGADSRQRIVAQQRAVFEADAAVRDARILYGAGLAGFLDVLDAQRSALARRQALLQAQGDAARAAVASFEAMGLLPPAELE